MSHRHDEAKELELHEKMARALFAQTWDLIDQSHRGKAGDEEMIHAAHGSRYHWTVLIRHGRGSDLHAARGDWLLARVHTLVGQVDAALLYARRSLRRCEADVLGAFDTAFAHEAIARACAVAHDFTLVEAHLEAAWALIDEVPEEDAAWLRENLETVPRR